MHSIEYVEAEREKFIKIYSVTNDCRTTGNPATRIFEDENTNALFNVWLRAKLSMVLRRIEGDQLPPLGAQVDIHLASCDKWVTHTVTGYYVWGSHEKLKHLHRVFVRVEDENGTPNARMLCDIVWPIQPKDGAPV